MKGIMPQRPMNGLKHPFLLAAFALAALLPFRGVAAQAAVAPGDLVRSDAAPAVYYYGADGKRYVFPNEKTYFTWYADFSQVKMISASELAAIPIGGNVTYRPGARMVKIQSDPKVYAVSKNGILRHVASEAVAAALYGADWNRKIDDVSDAFFVNYRIGEPVAAASGYDREALERCVPGINADKRLAAPPAGCVDAAASGFSPASISIPRNSVVTWIAVDGHFPFIASDPHPTHTNLPGLSSESLFLGETWSFTFTQTGTWGYHDHNNPSRTGTATVTGIVLEAK